LKGDLNVPYLPLKEATIYYEVEGQGEPLIFIHGMGLSHVNWRPQVDFFTKQGFKTITLDIRGHGRSTETLEAFKKENIIKQITQDVYQLLKGLDIEQGVFIGYSTGTVLCQDFALTYPGLTKGIVLSGAFPKISNLYLYGKFASSMGLTYMNARKILEKGVARSNGKDEEQINVFRQEAKRVKRKEAIRLLKASFGFDCRKQLKDIQAPILVTYGGNERHMMTYRHDYLRYAPSAEICMFPHVNHATPTKCTDSYNKVLLDFFNQVYEKEARDQPGQNYFFNPNKINPTPRPINRSLE
jgi:pimeloyl-ACP methyl ester carboxylesterase